MSAPPLAEQLQEIADGHRSALTGTDFPGADLAGLALPHANLRGLDLNEADLGEADLQTASASGLRLHAARLELVNLREADLTGADLSHVRGGQARLTQALLEDAKLDHGGFRFAHFDDAVLDGATLVEADLWGAAMHRVSAEHACLRGTRLDEVHAVSGAFAGSDMTGASLRRADFADADLRGAILRDAVVDGACFAGADLSRAVLPFVVMTECDLTHVRLAGAWLERTRMRASQLGGAVGEEIAKDYRGAYDAYTALELNFRSLGSGDEESWAYRRRRRMGKLAHVSVMREALRTRPRHLSHVGLALNHAGLFIVDAFVEWLSDYGESLTRVLRAFAMVLVTFAFLFWITGSLKLRDDVPPGARPAVVELIDYALFSLDSMTTVGVSLVELQPTGQLAVFLSSIETVLGTLLIGLFGFVLGARMRR